ncbi:Asp23/Gls24 family envelope stress response protein [Carnobacterium maltaromaticum]|uniref:Asp23/Gls24 family envelope stress response protein n=1 Tax=Carnobacterium maltaromaticum TaxID=2751 RepID=UPI001DAD8F3E|nr:Asp23/Gls24 family envelope stress response protein [Carnobacterium maltaromaticum]MCC4312115.1 stress response regulator Gls24 [Carnobacterium maltaromaticum]
MENQKTSGTIQVKGELTYEDRVIQKIVGIALESIDGLLTVDGGFFSNIAGKLVNTNDVTTGINVDVGKKQVAVDLDIVAKYGSNLAKIYNEIKEVVVSEVNRMTTLEVVEVNVNVVDVKTQEQYEKDSETIQDKVTDAAETTGNFASKQTAKAKNTLSKTATSIENSSESRVE